MAKPSPSPAERIYAVVRRIPPGRVATYGQVAALAGLPGHARQVGQALRETPEGVELPWQRVINAKGEVSPRAGLGLEEGLQRHLLQEEGVVFDDRGRIALDRFGWDPDARPPSRKMATRKVPPAPRKLPRRRSSFRGSPGSFRGRRGSLDGSGQASAGSPEGSADLPEASAPPVTPVRDES